MANMDLPSRNGVKTMKIKKECIYDSDKNLIEFDGQIFLPKCHACKFFDIAFEENCCNGETSENAAYCKSHNYCYFQYS